MLVSGRVSSVLFVQSHQVLKCLTVNISLMSQLLRSNERSQILLLEQQILHHVPWGTLSNLQASPSSNSQPLCQQGPWSSFSRLHFERFHLANPADYPVQTYRGKMYASLVFFRHQEEFLYPVTVFQRLVRF